LVAKSRLELESHVDHLIMRLQARVTQGLALGAERLAGLENRLQQAGRSWPQRIEQVDHREQRLKLAMGALLRRLQDQLGRSVGQLEALSPLGQLARGYVIASRDADSREVVRCRELAPGAEVWLRFDDGRVRTRVEAVSE
jgi:exodeoxyribonuclease VII large subunit